jgi:polar amino acid transport system substrate-binding protein
MKGKLGASTSTKILFFSVLIFLVMTQGTWGQMSDHPSNKPLVVAADVGFAPFIMLQPNGEMDGFMVDIVEVLTERLGRPGYQILDVNWAAIFAGLFAKKYEFILAPTALNAQRAKEMIFTEPYMNFTLGFMSRASESDLNGLDDLKGKTISVINGSIPDTWASENKARYGFNVQRYDKGADAFQALLTRRVDVNVSDDSNLQYLSAKQRQAKVSFYIDTEIYRAIPFRKEDVEFRNKVERILEGMKLDGTLAAIHKKWFGKLPNFDSSANKVWVGYGPVEYDAYTYQPHQPEF